MISKRLRLLQMVLVALLPFTPITQTSAHDEGPPHHAKVPPQATRVMKGLAADKLPAETLSALTGSTTTCTNGYADGYPCSDVDLQAFLPLADIGGGGNFSAASDIWGWTDVTSGREIAIIGRFWGTSFVDVTVPENPVYLGELPAHAGAGSDWRDIKVYDDHAYIVSEATGHGMQVFDLKTLPVVADLISPLIFDETVHYGLVGSAHNVVINEESGFAFIVGAAGANGGSGCNGGLHMVDLLVPGTPDFAGCYSSDGYTHDAQCVIYKGPDNQYVDREICFASNEDTVTIVDVTDKSAPIQINKIRYNGSFYTHQGWLTEDQRYFLLDDELDEIYRGHNTRTRVFDLRNLDARKPPVSVYEHDVRSIDHNQYVKGSYSYQANYRSGLRILDISDPKNPSLAAFFDIFPGSDSANFNGAWSVYPYFASGTVIVSGIEQGLFVLRPNLDSSPPVEPVKMHVHDLATSGINARGKFTASVTITIHDGSIPDEQAVEGAVVDGTFTPGGNVSCTTGTSGSCTVSKSFNKKSGVTSTSFTVEDVSRNSGDSYNPDSNHVGTLSILIP